MKKYLLPETGKFFKANLHCHTTVSDGSWSPERVKEEYKARGYSIVAYTDHDLMLPHPELCDDDFLAMNGYEMEVNAISGADWITSKTTHMCLVALTPDIKTQVCWNRKYLGYTWGNANELAKTHARFNENEPDFYREHTPEVISEMMCRGREAGFFVTYNHPAWSNEDYSDYINFEGMHAMEIVNYGCYHEGYEDYNPRVYDDMLHENKRIYCIATDDNHNHSGEADSFGGFTMIKAERLDYGLIGKALLNGHFYASEGPQIHSLWVENGVVHVECSPAVRISMKTGIIYAKAFNSEGGTPLTSASFEIKPNQKYFRITVTDASGKHACTNAYFVDEL